MIEGGYRHGLWLGYAHPSLKRRCPDCLEGELVAEIHPVAPHAWKVTVGDEFRVMRIKCSNPWRGTCGYVEGGTS